MTAALPFFAFMARRWSPLGRFADLEAARRAIAAERGIGFALELATARRWRQKEGLWQELPKTGPVFEAAPAGADWPVLVWGWRESDASAGSDFPVGRYPDFEAAARRLLGRLSECTLIAWHMATLETQKSGRTRLPWTQIQPPRREIADAGQARLEV